MEVRSYKNRERLFRGPLSSFKKLPEEKQKKFIWIAEIIRKYLTSDVKIYVFGSFYWGFWDENSDYDVIIDYSEVKKTTKEISEKLIRAHNELNKEGMAVDILTIKQNTGILIP